MLTTYQFVKIVVPAGIAGTQIPGMAWPRSIPATWIPAIHAGMTAHWELSAKPIGDKISNDAPPSPAHPMALARGTTLGPLTLPPDEAAFMRHPTRLSEPFVLPLAARYAVMIAAALITGLAAADELPTLRSGMWEFNRTIETPDSPGKPQTIQTKKCTSPSEDMRRQNEILTRGGCKFSPVSRAGNIYTYSAECKLQGAAGTSKSVLTVEDDAAYTIRIQSDFGGALTHELLKAKRVGDC